MYHAAIIVGLAIVYVLLTAGFGWFFRTGTLAPTRTEALRAVLFIVLAGAGGVLVSQTIADWQIANRVLHIVGGGFAAYLAGAFAARDARVAIGRARLVMVLALVATAMGVGNELMELVLQRYAHFRFAAGPLDTWLDLASNTVGIAIAAVATAPLARAAGAEPAR